MQALAAILLCLCLELHLMWAISPPITRALQRQMPETVTMQGHVRPSSGQRHAESGPLSQAIHASMMLHHVAESLLEVLSVRHVFLANTTDAFALPPQLIHQHCVPDCW